MISRIVDCQVRPEKLNEFRKALHEKFVPRIKSQTGFVDIIESIDVQSGRFVCNTFWKSRDDVNRYDNSLFQEVASSLTPYLSSEPRVETLEVETSTVHRISAGRSAAA
jgi:quinol monooxygenase YgiN